jgi:hypothetical protein
MILTLRFPNLSIILFGGFFAFCSYWIWISIYNFTNSLGNERYRNKRQEKEQRELN